MTIETLLTCLRTAIANGVTLDPITLALCSAYIAHPNTTDEQAQELTTLLTEARCP